MKNIYTLINKDKENKIEYFSYSNINWVWFYPIKYNYWSTDDYYDEGIKRQSEPFRIHKDSDKLKQYLKHSVDVDRIRSLRTDVASVAFTPTPF